MTGLLTAVAVGSFPSWSRTQGTVPDRTFLLERRIAGCPICRKMTENLPPGEFGQDAHAFGCRTCHHPHTQKTATEWRATCTQEGCHPRAWTRTVFHRVDARVFVNCMNCHVVHRWTADGQDCKSCHLALVTADTVTAVKGVAGVTAFPHPKHAALECAVCHRWDSRHAETLIRSKADCMACHHRSRDQASCAGCHGGRALAPRTVNVPVSLGVWPEARNRQLPFSHERHRGLECARCHGPGEAPPAARCGTCHEGHHRAEAECVTCHRPPPASAHPLSVHESGCAGSGCHAPGVAPASGTGRNLCLVCHQDQTDHNPGRPCASCHLVGPAPDE